MATLFDTLMKPKAPSDANVLGSIQEAKKTPMGTQQGLAPLQVQQAGKEALVEGQQQMAKEEALGGQQLSEMSMESQKAQAARNIALDKLAEKNNDRLAALGHETANQMAEESREFKVDEANRKYMNQHMLDQYAAEELLSSEAQQNYFQAKDQVMQRKAQLMQAYANQMEKVLQQGFIRENQELDQASKEKIARLLAAFKQKQTDALKKASKNAMTKQIITGAFTAAGAVVGGIYSAGTGTAAGAAAGSVLGAAVAENV